MSRFFKPALIFLVLGIVAVVVLCLFVVDWGGASKTDYAKMHMMNIIKACRSYHVMEEKFPSTLSVLIGADGTRPYLEGGAKAIVDPWGKPFKYALIGNDSNEMEPYVWSERLTDGKLAIIGIKYTKDAKYLWFECK
jgi:hypothetical protein